MLNYISKSVTSYYIQRGKCHHGNFFSDHISNVRSKRGILAYDRNIFYELVQ